MLERHLTILNDIFFLNHENQISPSDQLPISAEPPAAPGSWTKFYFIEDNAGAIRWIFPSESPVSVISRLETQQYQPPVKDNPMNRLLYRMGLNKLKISGSFYLNQVFQLPFYDLISVVPYEHYAIFVHTEGPGRKSIVALGQGKYISHFLKIAHTEAETTQIYNEVYSLQILAQRRLRKIVHPFLTYTVGDHAVFTSNVSPVKPIRSFTLSSLHVNALNEMYEVFQHVKEVEDIIQLDLLSEKLDELYQAVQQFPGLTGKVVDQIKHITDQLYRLSETIQQEGMAPVSFTHGDFNPWNMYISDKQLHIYDWEKSKESYPLLYDLFYFIYHTACLHPLSASQYFESQFKFASDQLKQGEILKSYHLDMDEQHRLFLLLFIPRRITKMLRSSAANDQLEQCLNLWEQNIQALI